MYKAEEEEEEVAEKGSWKDLKSEREARVFFCA